MSGDDRGLDQELHNGLAAIFERHGIAEATPEQYAERADATVDIAPARRVPDGPGAERPDGHERASGGRAPRQDRSHTPSREA